MQIDRIKARYRVSDGAMSSRDKEDLKRLQAERELRPSVASSSPSFYSLTRSPHCSELSRHANNLEAADGTCCARLSACCAPFRMMFGVFFLLVCPAAFSWCLSASSSLHS